MTALPSLFLSHGAPTMALDPGAAGAALARLGRRLPRPQAVLVLSAHWESRSPLASTVGSPDTIHDFGGFPRALYALQYPAPGAPALARRAAALLQEAGIGSGLDAHRGLDHGAWVPLLHLFPDADLPVTQLSIQSHLGPAHHYAVGQALRPLGEDGVLVIGSGSLTHNLREVQFGHRDGPAVPYVTAFQDWFAQRLAAADVEALLDYRQRAPEAARAHPTDEHLLPLFAALGAGGTGPTERLVDEVTYGVLAMDAYLFGGGK